MLPYVMAAMCELLHTPRIIFRLTLIAAYLKDIGTMLKDGHFSEARQRAESRKALFDKAYADEGSVGLDDDADGVVVAIAEPVKGHGPGSSVEAEPI
jgi:hypothetical protein